MNEADVHHVAIDQEREVPVGAEGRREEDREDVLRRAELEILPLGQLEEILDLAIAEQAPHALDLALDLGPRGARGHVDPEEREAAGAAGDGLVEVVEAGVEIDLEAPYRRSL